MALVASSNRDHRIYKPSFLHQYPFRGYQVPECRSRLLAKIHTAYRKALKRLTVNARRRFLSSTGSGGLCIGFLDPVSNIIINTLVITVAYKASRADHEQHAVLSLDDMARRSMDGLVTFLTRFFPYLHDDEALYYLLLGGADALVAAGLIVRDRGLKRFGCSDDPAINEEALAMALKCAAMVAGHPDPDRLVGTWLTVSSRISDVTSLLAKLRRRRRCLSSTTRLVNKLARLITGPSPPADLSRPWQLAASRRRRPRRNVPRYHTPAFEHAVLEAVHGFYLQALARLPAGELRARFHHSLLKAGHCYGPLDDPVASIIVNTVWYDAAFPPTHELDLDVVVGTRSLHRIQNRSMYGMASFLCTRYHHLNFRQATRLLLKYDANLVLADPNLVAAGSRHNALLAKRGPDTGIEEAFRAAAIAAHHPNPDAQAKLLASCRQILLGDPSASSSLLEGDRQLSSDDVQRLARLLCPASESSPSNSEQQQPLVPFPRTHYYVRNHTRIISKKVVAALNAYAPTSYELHVICGVNENVSGPVYCPRRGRGLGRSSHAPHKCYRSHVNFLATPKKGGGDQQAPPVLFFAEVSNDDDDEDTISGTTTPPLCCPVSAPPPCAERVRCLYCDFMGMRIVHPVGTDFHGRETEFEKMVCGEDPDDEDFDPALRQAYYTNMGIINHSRLVADEIHDGLEEDRLYAESRGSDRHMSDEDVDYDVDREIFLDIYE